MLHQSIWPHASQRGAERVSLPKLNRIKRYETFSFHNSSIIFYEEGLSKTPLLSTEVDYKNLIITNHIRSAGLWRGYINTTITILDIIHRPVFYLKLNSTLWVCPYLTRTTLRLRYEPNRLILSIGLWRWYSNITITILETIHRSVLYLKLNSIVLSVPYRKHITPPLRAQQVNAIYKFVTIVY
jgi:hypothetical protein